MSISQSALDYYRRLFEPGIEVAFIRCSGCGHDGSFCIDGEPVWKLWDFTGAVEVLEAIATKGAPSNLEALRVQVLSATWLQGYRSLEALETSTDEHTS